MIVVDTSVAIKWLNKEEKDSELAYSLYKKHIASIETIVIPPLLFIEAANTLATKSNSTKEDIKTGLTFLFEADFTLHNVVLEELADAGVLAKKYHTSVYDMLYAVGAKNKKCILVTADENFVKKTKFRHVKLLRKLEKKLS